MSQNTQEFQQIIDHLEQELKGLRTGRAHPAMLDNIMVEAYGGAKSPLTQLASVNVSDARSLLVEPWDKNIVKDIEKGIIESGQGFNPVNEGDKLRIVLPELTQERRLELVKVLNKIAEEARVKLRQLRDKARANIQKQEQAKEISEDEKFRLQKELEDKVKEYGDKIEEMRNKKQAEIVKV